MIDHHQIEELKKLAVATSSNLVQEIFDLYLESASSSINKIKSGLSLNNVLEIQRAAHGLKGSSANVGAKEIAHLCTQVENLARTNDLARMGVLIPELERVFEATRLELNSLR